MKTNNKPAYIHIGNMVVTCGLRPASRPIVRKPRVEIKRVKGA